MDDDERGVDGKDFDPARSPSDVWKFVISVKGAVEFRDWLDEVAEHRRISAVQVIDLALVEYARNHAFPNAAPKRTR